MTFFLFWFFFVIERGIFLQFRQNRACFSHCDWSHEIHRRTEAIAELTPGNEVDPWTLFIPRLVFRPLQKYIFCLFLDRMVLSFCVTDNPVQRFPTWIIYSTCTSLAANCLVSFAAVFRVVTQRSPTNCQNGWFWKQWAWKFFRLWKCNLLVRKHWTLQHVVQKVAYSCRQSLTF